MRKEIMDIVLKATDNASNTFEAVQDAAEDLERSLDDVGNEGTQDMERLEDGADQAGDDVRELGDEAKKTKGEVDDLGDGAEKAKEDVDKLGKESDETKEKVKGMGDESKSSGATMQMAFQNIADGVMRAKEGVVELGRNLMDTLELAGQQEQQETFLKMSIGTEKAAKQMEIINDLVADLPGDDVAIGGLLSQATAKNATITADELERMGTNAADYFAAMSNYGKSSVEAQQDLTNYILAGNTAELERSPVLQAHIDKLKEATTVEERNKALQEALAEEGWAGISMQDTYNNKLETFTAMLDRGKRQMGGLFLDAASGAMDFLSNLDTATGGILGMGIAIGTVAGGPMIDLVTGVGQMATGLGALRTAFEGTAVATAIAEGGFWSMAAAELAALWPILAIIAALVAVGVAIYEVGKYFGWWSDVGSMINAIWAGINRLWSAFINHPDVQAMLSVMSQAWNVLSAAVGKAISWVMSFFSANSGGKFDVVRALIDALGVAWKAMTLPIRLVITVVKLFMSTMRTVYNNVRTIINNIRNLWQRLPGLIRSAISSLVSIITQPFRNAYNQITGIVGNIKSAVQGITNIDLSSITNKIVQPFVNAYNRVSQEVSKIKAKANSITGGLLGAIGLGFDYEGMMEELEQTRKTQSYNVEEGEISIKQEIDFNFDFTGLPEGINEDQLVYLLKEAINDKGVINQLVNNPDFQSLDQKVKNRLALKSNRARGV